jgi:hypothetical protein
MFLQVFLKILKDPKSEGSTFPRISDVSGRQEGCVALEFGTFLGYSAVKIWRQLGPGAKAWMVLAGESSR